MPLYIESTDGSMYFDDVEVTITVGVKAGKTLVFLDWGDEHIEMTPDEASILGRELMAFAENYRNLDE